MKTGNYVKSEKGVNIPYLEQTDLRVGLNSGEDMIFPDAEPPYKDSIPQRNLTYKLERKRIVPQVKDGDVILDVGCGDWPHVSSHYKTVGVDRYRKNLIEAKEMFPEVDYVWGSAEHLPFKSNTFEGLVCVHMFVAPKPIDKIVTEMLRVGKPESVVVVKESKEKIQSIYDICKNEGLDTAHYNESVNNDDPYLFIRKDKTSI
ncbi:MAG: methyltransferase domain-containing protein [archaeon]|nr:methyltransferase domain-containing protein [archaeon]